MKNWGELLSEFDSLLNDSARASYPEALRVVAWQRACQYFAVTHTAMYKSATATATVYMDGTLVAKPSDFIELPMGGVQTVYDNGTGTPYRNWLEPVGVIAGGAVPRTGYILMSDGIYLPGGQDYVRLWYYAHYSGVSDSSTNFYLPEWSEWAIENLALSYMLYPRMVSQQNLRQFQDNSMRGTPEDNPPRAQALHFMKVYFDIVNPINRQERGILYRPGGRI